MSKINANTRFLVLNATNQVIKPKDEMIPGFLPAALKSAGVLRKQYSPSFLGDMGEESARGFAEALAKKYPGQRFYVTSVLAGVQSATVQWAETGALADEHVATEVEDGDGLDDGSENC